MEVIAKALEFLPTASVMLVLGIFTYRAQERGRKDTADMQHKAEKFSENQAAVVAWKDLYYASEKERATEHERRVEAEKDADECRKLVRSQFEEAVRSVGVVPKSET